ncbi:aminodeoxychorismate synthase [Vibrio neptunius]|uniref:aminodeoxychorismate synthase component I n=1 Tax=Vibrio TaxID=662 RepID=UPI0005FA1B6D|nr:MULTISPECIES: aminodeoxychorismate synthase component I [Vibrio]KJY93088.1 aminodeoxychorismate synthase [Vibrio neptunius]MBN3572840.1 aminodeoxychorismate synthase component I [Vibrio neptunius]NRB67333.1 aminodeoxychorismate synthase component I [Vibrio sp.]
MNNSTLNCLEIKPINYHPELSKRLFSRIEDKPWSMLLRSASDNHIDSRFDILVADPIVKLTTCGELTKIVNPAGQFESGQDPFTLLEQQQNQWLPNQEYKGDLPFIGGALGYFAYDLGRRVEKLPKMAERDLSSPDMAVGIYEWAVVVDHKEKQAFVVGENVERHYHWLESQTNQGSQGFSLCSPWQSNMSKQAYRDRFHQVQEYLRSGDCYQINLAQRFSAQYSGSEWHAYQKLESVNKGPFSAFVRTECSAILSVSPERFLQVHDRLIETKPIKGTRPRYQDAELDSASAKALAMAEKDQAENLMIVDLLRNDVGRVAKPGSVHVPKLFDIESFPAVHHLVSTIRAELDIQYSPADLLRASFPGGSITGAPKIRAMEIIEELEPHCRSAYCGSIGYISRHGSMDTSITIRTLIAEGHQIHVWAGGGLVADSDSEAEYQETLDKLCRILPVLEN